MSKTAWASADALTVKLWNEQLFRDAAKEAYFNRFMGTSANSLVQTDTKLTKSKGDSVTFGIVMRLQGAGVTSGMTLEGNEESLVDHDYSVTLEQYRHAVRDAGALDRQRVMYGFDEVARDRLKDWGAEKIDQLCFDAVFGSPTRIFYRDGTAGAISTTATAATAKSALTATNSTITPGLLKYAKTWAKTGGNRAQTPLRPVRVDGKDYFVMLIHPDSAYDLKEDSTYAQAIREAEVRGKENPLFTGSLAIYDGIVIHEHENCPIATDAGSGSDVPWSKAVLMGQQALCWAWGEKGSIVAEEFDYGNEHGFGWNMIAGAGKPVFNSLDYGSVGLYLARTQISDAS